MQVKTDMSCARSNSALLPSPIGNGEAAHRLHAIALSQAHLSFALCLASCAHAFSF